jgi:hypothetical protein
MPELRPKGSETTKQLPTDKAHFKPATRSPFSAPEDEACEWRGEKQKP